jgi:hypothetical protein
VVSIAHETMSEYTSAALESAVTDERIGLEPRDVRSLTQFLTVIPETGDIYEVVSQSGSAYRVDAREDRCTCPDHQHNDARCKHIRRVAFETGREAIPSWVDPDALPDDFGLHVNARPVVVTTDGGQSLEVDTTGVDGQTDTDDGRPDDCSCDAFELEGDLCCFDCWLAGYRERP